MRRFTLLGVALISGIYVAFLISAQPAAVQAQSPAATHTSGFVGAEACKDCHTKVFDAWSATKHARALSKLSAANKTDRCIGCHVTGTKEMVAADGPNPTFPNVQCEACHGPGQAHVTAAKAGDAASAKTRPITEEGCVTCHNDASPHYKTFIFSALKGMSHPAR